MKNRFYLCYNWSDKHDKYLGVITDRHPHNPDGTMKDGITVLSVELADTVEELQKWFNRVCIERPWETRQ